LFQQRILSQCASRQAFRLTDYPIHCAFPFKKEWHFVQLSSPVTATAGMWRTCTAFPFNPGDFPQKPIGTFMSGKDLYLRSLSLVNDKKAGEPCPVKRNFFQCWMQRFKLCEWLFKICQEKTEVKK